MVFGVIVSNRSFFPDHLVATGRRELLEVLKGKGHSAIILPEDATPLGAVESIQDGIKCAELFNAHPEIDGIILCLPNFGTEGGVNEAINRMHKKVPILVQASDDDLKKMDLANRRDAFCGKLSMCSVFKQNGIQFTGTRLHTCAITSEAFSGDIDRFEKVCAVVAGLKNACIGVIGTRPDPFQTVRFSEKLFQRSGIRTTVVDMSQILAAANKLAADDPRVQKAIDDVKCYGTQCAGITDGQRLNQAKLTVATNEWVSGSGCDAITMQCWDSLQMNLGCTSCVTMSMLGEAGIPAACEGDGAGAVSMLALRLASGGYPGLMDWDNNYGDDRDKCVNVHCANYPREFYGSPVEIGYLDVLGTTLGTENCFGAVKGRIKGGDMTFLRVSTDDAAGKIKCYVGEGDFTDDPLDSFGGVAVCHVEGMQDLMHYLIDEGFEHHVALVRGHHAEILTEALGKYLGWQIHHHK